MKTFNGETLNESIRAMMEQTNKQVSQVKELEGRIKDFANLEQSFNGEGGRALRNFYQDWHGQFLEYQDFVLNDYQRSMEQLEAGASDLESDKNGFIRQSFLETELKNALDQSRNVTSQLVDEANGIMDRVSDIVYIPRLDDAEYLRQTKRAQKQIDETIEALGTFDRKQTSDLSHLEQDIEMMKRYVNEMQGLLENGSLSIAAYESGELKDGEAYEELTQDLVYRVVGGPLDVLTTPADYVRDGLSWSDTALVGTQAMASTGTFLFTRKMKVNYLDGKPKLWDKVRGNYRFSLSMDPNWTSETKYNSKLARTVRNFQKSNPPKNSLMKSLHNVAKTYDSPAHMVKHLAGFPKNMHNMTGKGLMSSFEKRVDNSGTRNIVGKALDNKTITNSVKRVPGATVAVSLVSNFGELYDQENRHKSLGERTGRAVGGIVTDAAAISGGAKIGAMIGSVGGPVGVVVGGAIGGTVGGYFGSKHGGKVKDIGEAVGGAIHDKVESGTEAVKEGLDNAGEAISSVRDNVEDGIDNMTSSIKNWFN
ncbi:hypothetical protein N781_15715 [Pontibacillus halophilus JSM 076056 = DSM 19796]|uniref:LXG domain-containing protein n=1 Tax=Pontibacillus halophilus JSM 076056 = DSM 19796 TaxID=1385510 RepID=A0A0A5GLC1_9BACI|nr:LXG domain-containing protein [Pontibacillus halophilus]KGX92809.1 hypothetical protein N781_15715 [Pontibacillus halophilus JSM 076056 = DSM 19796]